MKLPSFTASRSLVVRATLGIRGDVKADLTATVRVTSGNRAEILPAVFVNKATRTDQQWLDETCLDARDVPNVASVTLDQSWHRDARAPMYGDHLTFSLYDNAGRRLDTCHAYQEMTAGGCLVTFCQNNYAGHGTPDGTGFYGYFADTHP